MGLGVRGSAGLYAIGGDSSPGSGGMLDTSQPAGWHSIFWWSAVLVIAFLLWAL